MKGPRAPKPPPGTKTADGHHVIHAVGHRVHNGSRIVLVVDDEMSIRHLLRRKIEWMDPRIRVEEAKSGREALQQLREIRVKNPGEPALIILDLKMPEMDGWEVVAALKKDYEARGDPQGIPLIVFSQSSGDKGLLRRQSVHQGKTGYVPLVTVAKEACARKDRFDSAGEEGLTAWLEHFLSA